MKYADVILPLPLENYYTYSIPPDLEKAVAPGCRVLVHFGKKKYYTGIVMLVHERSPAAGLELKEIYALLDTAPVLRRPQLQFWRWIAFYYVCKLADVYKAAVPAGLKLESETVVELNELFEADAPLRQNEQLVLDVLHTKPKFTVSELEKKTGLRNVVSVITSLMRRGAIRINEEMKRGFTPKMQTFIRLTAPYHDELKRRDAFSELKRAPKQEALLLRYLDVSHALHPSLAQELSKKELIDKSGFNLSILDALIKRGILESYEKETGRLQVSVCRLQALAPLTGEQKKAYREIHDAFKTKDVCLLQDAMHGGKTEVYAHLIDEALRQGRQVLYLLPEIAITAQITERLAKLFGNKLLAYHSKFSDNERVEVWNKLLRENVPMLVLGVRSSLFLPFGNLGLIIVDEEHENTYKQQEPAPRYHARSAAIMLANMHGGKTLLGSATPSIDSYYNATTGKYGWVELNARLEDRPAPEIIAVDIKELKRKKIMKDTLFSPLLIREMHAALEKGEQCILFQNRRGFAPVVECRKCGWTPRCMNCDVSLTYHKHPARLECHYCGYREALPGQCAQCQSAELKMAGFGTEKVEEEVAHLFPAAKAGRLDVDSAKTRNAYGQILSDFDKGKTHILIGTQMLSRGLDFASVGVVGILNADSLMNYPDFRAHERAFQLMAQLGAHTAGRDKRGTVILQTSQPEHPLIRMVQQGAYKEMASLQLGERSMFHYPPYYRLIAVTLRSRNESVLEEASALHAGALRARLGERALGPVTPPVTRVQTLHIRKILLKIETAVAIAPIRQIIESIHADMQKHPSFKQLLVHYDVDPV
ncbi:MAG: primosomal protein N' [Tannerellaceae bacterium]|jgi:primosomal protein N' (replication factor Y)|nr:primosomal protein N' [Tannerellaceae bacterium]